MTERKSFDAVRSWMEQIKLVSIFLRNIGYLPTHIFMHFRCAYTQHAEANISLFLVGNKCELEKDRVRRTKYLIVHSQERTHGREMNEFF